MLASKDETDTGKQLTIVEKLSKLKHLVKFNSYYAAINVMPHPPQAGLGGALVGGLTQNLGLRGRDFDPE